METKKVLIIGTGVVALGVIAWLVLRKKPDASAAAPVTTPTGGATTAAVTAPVPTSSSQVAPVATATTTPAAATPGASANNQNPVASDVLPTSTAQSIGLQTTVVPQSLTAQQARDYLHGLVNQSYWNQVINTMTDYEAIGLASWSKNEYSQKIFTSTDPDINNIILNLRSHGWFYIY